MNFSSVRHSHGVPVRTRLFQLVFLTGSQIVPVNLILSTGPKVLTGACFPWGPTLLQATICSSVGSSRAAGRSLLHHGPPCATGAQLHPHVLHHKGSSTCSTSCPSFYTDLGVCRAVRLSFLSPGCNCEGFLFFSFCLNISESLSLLLTLSSDGFFLEPAGIGSLRHCRKLLAPS